MVGVALEQCVNNAGTSVDSSTEAGDALRKREEVSTQRQHTDRDKLRHNGEASVDELPAAGLSSDRCTRDFASLCNRRLHSGRKLQPSVHVSTTYQQKRAREFALDWIVKNGKTILTHGLTPSVSTADKKTSIQMKLLENYVRYNHLECTPQTPRKQLEVTDSVGRERDVNRLRNMQHCRIFNDVDTEERPAKQQDLDPRTFTVASDTAASTVMRADAKCLSRVDSTPSMSPQETEVTIIGGLRAVNNTDPEWEIVSFRMSGIKPFFTEKDFEALAREANMQVVSVNLDRNIITHSCNGTGNIRCRHTGGERALMHFSRLFAKAGIRLYITDIISKSDVLKRPLHYATTKS